MLRRVDKIELIVVVISLFFAITISFYHVAQDGELGLSIKQWRTVWAISENGLSLLMSAVIVLFSYGAIKLIFKGLFIPYFTIKLIYHFSCFSGIYILSPDLWKSIWSIICILILLSGLIIFLIKYRNARNT